MICPTCQELIAEPSAIIGGRWLWRCTHCQKQLIGPAQPRNGSVTRSGITGRCYQAAGEIPWR